ncbi:MAG: hypothetical protein ABR529_08845 [Actinomycetota bacterium]
MTYLGIFVLVAAAGCTRLWLQHRGEVRARRMDAGGLKSTLERLATRPAPSAEDPLRPLGPARRAAAKRRIEARRAARSRAAG